MGALLGLTFGIGVLLIWQSGPRRAPRRTPVTPSLSARLALLLTQAGYAGLRVEQLIATCAVVAVLVTGTVAAVTGSVAIAIAFGAFAAHAPMSFLRMRRRQRIAELRDQWPDVVDNLASAIRAGLSLPEAVAQLAVRGPTPLRPAFQRFAEEYRTTGRFGECLDRLKATLADPVGDRIVESLRVAREVGGTDLGRLLRTLSQFLREDARTRAELETRQGWTVNAARLALAAPWVVLGMLSLRPQTVQAYDTVAGVAVLGVGAAVSLLAYRLMIRIARLPEEDRVLG